MHDALTEERLRLYPRALLGALGTAVVLAVARAGLGDPAQRLGGDYPSFHAAGELVVAGRGAALYDRAAQQAAQAPYLPDGAWLPFPYPPPLAVAHGLLAPLPYGLAFFVHTMLMVGALALAVRRLRPVLGLRIPGEAALAVCLTFLPLGRAVLGGQGTPLLVLLLALVFRSLHDDQRSAAGAWAALLLYKPTFGLPMVLLVALRTRGRSLPASGAVLLALAGVSAAVAGVGWPTRWWALVAWFQPGAQALEVASSVSLLAVAEALLGLGSPGALAVGGVASLLLATALAWAWATRPPGPMLLVVTAAGLPLLPPHGLFYDAGLAGLAVLAAGPRVGLGLWVVGLASALAPVVGLQPLVPALVALVVWGLRRPGA